MARAKSELERVLTSQVPEAVLAALIAWLNSPADVQLEESLVAVLVAHLPVEEGTWVVRRHVWGSHPCFVDARQAQLAYWMYRVADFSLRGIHAATRVSILGSALAAAQLQLLRQQHPELSRRFLTAQLLTFMDEPHKLKDIVRQLQQSRGSGTPLAELLSQRRLLVEACNATASELEAARTLAAERAELGLGSDDAAGEGGFRFLGKTVLQAVLDKLVEEFHCQTPQQQLQWRPSPVVLSRIVRGCTDEQHVRSAQALLGSPQLAAALHRFGYRRQALVMRTLHAAFEAQDARHLTSRARTELLQCRTELLLQMMGNRPFVPLARMPAKVHGMTTQLMCSWLGNADNRLQLLERLPDPMRNAYVERASSTYDVEGLFSVLKQNLGYKPTPCVVAGKLSDHAWMAEQRAIPEAERGYALPGDHPSHAYAPAYSSTETKSWNDGGYVGEYQTRRMKAVSVAATTAACVKPATVRSYFVK